MAIACRKTGGDEGSRSPSDVSIEEIRVASSGRSTVRGAIEEIAAGLADADVGFLLLFSSPHYDPEELVRELGRALPQTAYAGCSTAGEIGPDGLAASSVVALAFPSATFRIACTPLADLDRFSLETGHDVVDHLQRLLPSVPDRTCGTFALTLLDGLCRREELVLAALQRALTDIPLVGGSSGDDLAFRDTYVFTDGRVLRGAGLLLLVCTELPFRVFKSDHFEPTATRMVVTACDPETRVVSELDAEPAWEVFARATDLDPRDLSGVTFAAHPLLVRVGGDYYCRSIQKLNEDGSLSFYCAIDTGVVLTAAKTKDLVDNLEETLVGLDADLGGLDFVIGFDCVHRRLEAESRQVTQRISDLFRRWRVVGFNTYGEQYNSMHLNHTFSGVAFGRGRAAR